VTMPNTPNLVASLATVPTVNCPSDYYPTAANGECTKVSLPVLKNDLFWQNRPFHLEVGGPGAELLNQQNVVTLVPTLNQTSTGDCPSGASYWDIGVRGDTGPSDHSSGFTLTPLYSILTDASDYPSGNNLGADPALLRQYCNGSRLPPENGGLGYAVPPGVADATVPNPLFNLTPSATVDEGNNWINMSYGPLSLFNMALIPGSTGYNVPLGDYSIATSSPAVNSATGAGAPDHDFFGNPRPSGASNPASCGYDVGAVQLPGPANCR